MPIVFRESKYGLGSFECVLRERKMPYAVEMIEGTGCIELCSSLRHGDWKGVLLHEMVHAYFATVGLGHEQHGALFHSKCDRIEEELGHAIPRPKAKTLTSA